MLEIVEGEPCNFSEASCIDEAMMLQCIEGYWTAQPCEDFCASLGPGVSSSGCDSQWDTQSSELSCECAPPSDGCYPRQGSCDDQDTISWCADDWTWVESSCVVVCEERSLLSRGCDSIGEAAICLCTNTGTPCEGDASVCADDSTLSACEGGLWVELDCAEACNGEAACVPAVGGAGCVCG